MWRCSFKGVNAEIQHHIIIMLTYRQHGEKEVKMKITLKKEAKRNYIVLNDEMLTGHLIAYGRCSKCWFVFMYKGLSVELCRGCSRLKECKTYIEDYLNEQNDIHLIFLIPQCLKIHTYSLLKNQAYYL